MSKPRVAIFDFACCEGCQLQIVNLETELLDLITVVQPVQWREAMSEHSDEYDIAIVEGSITRPEDEERVKAIRAKAGILVAIGACATIGGINKLKNRFDLNDVKECVYGKDAGSAHLGTAQTKSVGEVVKVDYNIHGCPINPKEFVSAVKSLALGKTPAFPNYPVCVECKKRGTVCRFEYDEICLGPITRAGCNAPCPTAGFFCYGCRGVVDDPNVNAAMDVLDHYGKTADDLKSRMSMFLSEREREI